MMGWTRRSFLRAARAAGVVGAGGVGGLPIWQLAHAIGAGSRFRIARARLPGMGAEDPRPGAISRLIWEVLKRTSVDGDLDSPLVRVGDPVMFQHPFLLLAAEGGFSQPPEADVERLRRWLGAGGFLLADSLGGEPGTGFDASFRKLMRRTLPDLPLAVLPSDHTIYKSFYLLDRPYGRVQVRPHLEGIDRDDRSMVVYSQNDMPGAWARGPFGSWLMDVRPGGERQREMAMRMGVNAVLYALTLNYKRDQVHVPFLLKKRKWRAR